MEVVHIARNFANRSWPQGLLLIALLLSLGLYVFKSIRSTATRLPGPIRKPLVGNLFDFNPAAPWSTFTSWRAQYGNIVGLKALGNDIVVLNDLETINELLDKRGAKYSHRPVFTVVGELMELDKSMPLLPYGSEWRACRKMTNVALSPSASAKYRTVQEDIAAVLAAEILADATKFFDQVQMAAGRIILAITYGLSIHSTDSKYLTHADKTMKIISESTIPGAYLCDLLPFLKHAPAWISFRRKAALGRDMIAKLVHMPFEKVKEDIQSGTALPSLAQDLLSRDEEKEDRSDYENRIMWTTGSMYGAGSETTYSTVLNFIMAMALNPDVQKRAQNEITDVFGSDHLPIIADRHKLPYVEAVIKEVMRWNPILPLSIARRAASEDRYKGFLIPEGAIVMPNSWAIAFEPNEKYPPDQFLPDRFLDTDVPCTDPGNWAFGYGRRICPGRYLAENSVFAFVTTLLFTFCISQDPAAPLTPTFAKHLVRYPSPFRCQFTPRSEERTQIVQARASQRLA